MTNEEFFEAIAKRKASGASFRNPVGRLTQWVSFQYALELHRLRPHCPDVPAYHILRLLQRKLEGGERQKSQMRHDLMFYRRLEQIFNDCQWPAPCIPNNVHDAIRMSLQTCQRRIDNGHSLGIGKSKSCDI